MISTWYTAYEMHHREDAMNHNRKRRYVKELLAHAELYHADREAVGDELTRINRGHKINFPY